MVHPKLERILLKMKRWPYRKTLLVLNLIKKVFYWWIIINTSICLQWIKRKMAVQENFAGIDFDEIKEATSLEFDEIKVLKLCFNLFDVKKQDFLGSDDLVIYSGDLGWDSPNLISQLDTHPWVFQRKSAGLILSIRITIG